MSTPSRIDSGQLPVDVQTVRSRQTERPATPFRDVLAGGAQMLLAGAEVAASVAGGPILTAAVRTGVSGIAGIPTGPLAGGPGGGSAAGIPTSSAGQGADMAQMHAMQRESQAFNMQLLGLQEEVQQENRRFTTITNVLRAKHDTAKAALGNIRS